MTRTPIQGIWNPGTNLQISNFVSLQKQETGLSFIEDGTDLLSLFFLLSILKTLNIVCKINTRKI
jgi:hypothetical protein